MRILLTLLTVLVMGYCHAPVSDSVIEFAKTEALQQKLLIDWEPAAFTTCAYHLKDFGIKIKTHTLISSEEEGVQLFDGKADPFNLQQISALHPEMIEHMLEFKEASRN